MEGGNRPMSSNIDERVVQMQFDNKQFESGIKTSLTSIDKLKGGLNFDGAVKGMSNLEKAGRSFSIAGMAAGIDAISSRFTTLGIMGVTAIQNITNSALDAGKRIVSSLTVDPIKTGLAEYETKMGAIQTILTNTASKGTTLDQVNAGLAELNDYADKTIYNFAQMTDNASKFTAAGLGFKESITVIKGLSNVAAGFGVDASRMAGATYQMSQALSTGTVKLLDWKSMETAGMGGEMIQKVFKQTAKDMGVYVEDSIAFRDTLEKGWLTSEIFIKTMDKMAKDKALLEAAQNVTTFTKLLGVMKESMQSGWAVSWEKIIGDKNKSTAILTMMSNAFANLIKPSTDARNAILSFWDENGGQYHLVEALFNTFKGLSEILAPIREAFRDIFPAMTGKRLLEITERIRDLTRNFKISSATTDAIKATFKGLFAILDIGKDAFVAIVGGIGSLIKVFAPASQGLLGLTGSIGTFFVGLRETLKKTDAFKLAINSVITFIESLVSTIKKADVFNTIVTKIGNIIGPISEKVKAGFISMIESFKAFKGVDLSGITDFFEAFKTTATKPLTFFKELIEKISVSLGKFKTKMSEVFKSVNVDTLLLGTGVGGLTGIFLVIKKFITWVKGFLSSGGGVLDGINDVLDGIRGCLEAYQTQLKAGALIKIATAIAILAASLLLLSFIDPTKLTSSILAATALFAGLVGSMVALEKLIGSKKSGALMLVSVGMIAMATALLILTSAMVKIGDLSWSQIAQGVGTLGALSLILVYTAEALDKTSGKLIKSTLGLNAFASAILILVGVIKAIGVLDLGVLTQGLIGLGLVVLELALFMKIIDKASMNVGTGVGLIALSGAILILAGIVEKFGKMPIEILVQGLKAIGIVLIELGIFAMAANGSKGILAAGLAMVVMAGALAILVGVLKKLGELNINTLQQGMLAVGILLTIIAIAMTAMTKALPGAAALLIISAALGMLIPVITVLGILPLAVIGKGLLAIAAAFVVIGLAGLLLGPLAPAIMLLAGAIALLGLSFLAVGAGMVLFSAGLAALAVAGVAGAGALVVVVTSVANLIPLIIAKIGEGIVGFAKVIADGAPAMSAAMVIALTEFFGAIIQLVPKAVETVIVLITSILKKLVEFIPAMVDAGLKLLLGFLKGISDNIQAIVISAVEIATQFISGIAKMLPKIIQSGFDLMLGFINGLADSIRKNTGAVMEAVKNLMMAITEQGIKILKDAIVGFKLVGGLLIDSLKNAIKNKIASIVEAMNELADKCVTGLKDKVKEFVLIGANVVQGFINGIKDKIKDAKESIANLGDSILTKFRAVLGIHSPGKESYDDASNHVDGFNNGIKDNAKKAVDQVKNMAMQLVDAGDSAPKAYQTYGLDIVNNLKDSLKKNTPVAVDAASDMSKQVSAAGATASKGAYESAVEWMDERKYYSKLTLTEELIAWQDVQKKYKEGSEERKKIDREVYRVKQELIKAEETSQKDSFNHSMEWIEERKYYNQLSLTEELAAWERVQQRYALGTEERKKADREVYRLSKELTEKKKALEDDYYAKTKEVNDKLTQDIQRLNDEYDNAVKSRTESLYNAYGLFDEIAAQDPISGTTLVKNLEDQVAAFESWQKDITGLADKGINAGLLKELTDMGPQSAAQIKALNTLSAPELTRYAALWQTKYNEANTQAISELQDLRIKTIEQIATLADEANIELSKLNTSWETSLLMLITTSGEQLTELNTVYAEKITTLAEETVKKFKDISTTITAMDWQGIGVNIVKGMSKGVESQAKILADTVANVAKQALQAAKIALGIKSPSTAFEEVGMYADKGFVNGLIKFSGLVSTAATNVGKTAVKSLSNAIGNIANTVDMSIDSTPVIRPVLDLTNIEAGGQKINSLFAQRQGINVSAINSKIPIIGQSNSVNDINTPQTSQTTQTAPISFVQNNYSPAALSRLDIYRQTRNQISAMKGLVSGA